MIAYPEPQGGDAWLERRRGSITASRAKDARDKLKNGEPSAKAILYAQDVARERCGGKAEAAFVSYAMRFGTEQEAEARMAYEVMTGEMVDESGFVQTDDFKFGCSVDGLVGDDGLIEIKTLVSSGTLFRAMVEGDHSEYIDQINFELWMLGRKWCDLCLWVPDLPKQLTVVRINRDEAAIEALEADMLAFERIVDKYVQRLQAVLAPKAEALAA